MSCQVTNPFGNYHVNCGGNRYRILTQLLVMAVFCHHSYLTSALAPRKEVPYDPSNKQPPANIYLPKWKCGLPSALDVTCHINFTIVMLLCSSHGHLRVRWTSKCWPCHMQRTHSAGLIFAGGGKEGWSREAVGTLNCISMPEGPRARIPLAESIRIVQP